MRIDRPETLTEALELMSADGAKALAGGTNVMVDIKKGREQGEYFVSLDALEELKQIEEKPDGLHIGSLVTFAKLETYLTLHEPAGCAALREAAASVGGPQIRNRGTVGGNILCGSPSSDTVPALMVLDAELKLIRRDGAGRKERRVLLADFILGVRKTDLQPGEVLTEILVPVKRGISCFYKAGTRKAMAISVVNQAMYLELGEDGVIEKAAVASGSVAPVVVRAPKTEAFLVGKTRDMLFGASTEKDGAEKDSPAENGAMETARLLLAKEIAPISDLRAEKEYRLLVACNILEENLKTLLGG